MNHIQEKVLAKIRPRTIASQDAPWQQRKSSETRIRILEATIDCLVERGYSGLATNEVATRAGVSRGAMHHHFVNRMALVGAVIDYVFYQRMKRFLADYFASAEDPRLPDNVARAAETYWHTVQEREFAAWLELTIAARTDAELAAHFIPATQRFDKIWSDEMMKSFPQWKKDWDQLQLASDFAMAAYLGLLIHKPLLGDPARIDAVRGLIGKIIVALHAEA